jgi:hypothetical protein
LLRGVHSLLVEAGPSPGREVDWREMSDVALDGDGCSFVALERMANYGGVDWDVMDEIRRLRPLSIDCELERLRELEVVPFEAGVGFGGSDGGSVRFLR